eukprot:scaffold587_cov339-Pavlova_lutheri.AAC.25
MVPYEPQPSVPFHLMRPRPFSPTNLESPWTWVVLMVCPTGAKVEKHLRTWGNPRLNRVGTGWIAPIEPNASQGAVARLFRIDGFKAGPRDSKVSNESTGHVTDAMGACSARMRHQDCKYVYLVMFVVSTIVSWVLRDYGGDALDGLYNLDHCMGNTTCLGKEAVLRISCGSAIFFFILCILSLGVREAEDPREAVNSGMWLVKVPLWMGLIAGFFFVPGDFADVYFQISRVGGAIYLVLQAIILLDFVYDWNELWLERPPLSAALVALTVVLNAASLTGIGFMYHFFAPSSSCSLNIFFITFTLVLAIGYTVMSVTPWRAESAGLFTSAAIFAYSVYLTWSSIMSQPPGSDCNTLQRQEGETGWTTIAGFVITMLSVIITTVRAGERSKTFAISVEEGMDSDQGLPYRPDFFHMIFMLASMMVAMILTGWSESWTHQQLVVDESWVSTWMKISTLWLIDILYVWSMIAHHIFGDREF